MLLRIQGLKKLFGSDIILDGVDLRIESRTRLAIVGRNGCGKTTLLKLIIGEYEPDGGVLQLGPGVKVGYLSQHQLKLDDLTVYESAAAARRQLLELRDRLRELEQAIEHDPTSEQLEEFAMLHEHFEDLQASGTEGDVQAVLSRLGFAESDFEKPVSSLSGGERTRLALARLLLEEPDLLILDEPTNHLDIDAIEWLEQWLRSYRGSVILVSHDRQFLNQVAEQVMEISNGKSRTYKGNYDRFVELAMQDDERLIDVARKQEQEMAKLDEYVRRFMNSQRTAQARGRLKQLEKLEASAVKIEAKQLSMAAGFRNVKRSGDIVLDFKGTTKSFGDQLLFRDVNWQVRWSEKWGVIGPNGAGKSTLIRAGMGEIPLDSGSAKLGSRVELGWFSQDVDWLDLDETPLEAVCGETGLEFGPARNLLARFLVTGEDVFRPMKTMSGGERVKVALACITGREPNFLVMDEPSNHLDMDSCEGLAQVLKEFPGTLVLISHDRWLLQEVCGSLLAFEKGGVNVFLGNYVEYRERANSKPTKAPPKTNAPSPATTLSPRELSKAITKLEKDVADIELQIAKSEGMKRDLETRMSQPTGEDVVQLSKDYQSISASIDALMDHWQSASLELEELQSQRG